MNKDFVADMPQGLRSRASGFQLTHKHNKTWRGTSNQPITVSKCAYVYKWIVLYTSYHTSSIASEEGKEYLSYTLSCHTGSGIAEKDKSVFRNKPKCASC